MEMAVGGGRRPGLAMPRFCCIDNDDATAESEGGCMDSEKRLPTDWGTLKFGMVDATGPPKEAELVDCQEVE